MAQVRILCAVVGTFGDIHPAIAVAIAARELGAEVMLGVGAQYLEKVRSEGVSAIPIMDEVETRLRNRGWTPEEFGFRSTLDPGLQLRELVLPTLPDTCRAIDASAQYADVVVGTMLCLGAPLVAEARGIPYVPLLLQPPRAPFVGPLQMQFERQMAERNIGPAIDELRALGGLGPRRACPLLEFDGDVPFRIGLFSKLFSLPPEIGQPPLHVVGSWRYDAGDAKSREVSADLDAFLAKGPPPVIATLGTAVDLGGRKYFETWLAAIRATGRRAVLVTGRGWHGPDRGEDFIAVQYAPYRAVFPRCAAVIHHGGMGTLTFALEAARPQVIVPQAYDQPQNAEMARRKGLAIVVPPVQLTVPHATFALNEALRIGVTPQLEAAAQDISGEKGAETAARMLIDLAIQRRQSRPARAYPLA